MKYELAIDRLYAFYYWAIYGSKDGRPRISICDSSHYDTEAAARAAAMAVAKELGIEVQG